MGIAANVRLFRYLTRTAAGGASFRQCFCIANIHTSTLNLGGLVNSEPNVFTPNNVINFVLPLASRGGSIHPAARVVVIEFTEALPPGLVTRRQSILVPLVVRFEAFSEGMTGTFRGLPVKLVQKIDGRPDINGRF